MTPPSRRDRILVALLIGVASGLATFRYIELRFPPLQASDMTPIYLGAQALLQGLDPYSTVRARTDIWLNLNLYPVPASLLVVPLLGFPIHVAAGVFLAIGAGWLAYAVTREAWWPLLIFASGAFWWSIESVQWSPLLIATALSGPVVGLTIAAKPTYVIPLLAMQTRRRTVIIAIAAGAAFLLFSLAIRPSWPVAYYHTVRNSPVHNEYVAPAFTLLGSPLWLAALRWRDWRGRLVLGMALTPLNALTYSAMPLLLVAGTRLELMLLCTASWIGYALSLRAIAHITGPFLTPHIEPIPTLAYYLPALAVVLRRPNVGRVTTSLERRLAKLPRWLRGSPTILA
jgi:hypothetical protein